jgi:hypothetical protein
MGLAERLAKARSGIEEFEAEKAAVENALKALIGDASGVEGDGWRITWRSTSGSKVRNWDRFIGAIIEAVARKLGGPDEEENRKTAVALVNATLDATTDTRPGVRRFLYSQTRGSE